MLNLSPLAAAIADFCQKNNLLTGHDKIVVGVSGGPDSLALLRVLQELSPQFNLTLTVAHLNHLLRGHDAQADADFVRDLAAQWHLPVVVETQPVANLAADRRQSIETTARQVRYAFLWRVALNTGANKIAVGHNADDQVETILMHILRGSGLTGLCGILPLIHIAALNLPPEDTPPASLAQTAPQLIRPLLDTPRHKIEAYCQSCQLTPRQDHTNQDTTFLRNRLRSELLPYLETYNPNIRQTLRRMAQTAAADTAFLAEQTEQTWRFMVKNEDGGQVEIDLFSWQSLPLALKRAILRRAAHSLLTNRSDIHFEHIDVALAVIAKQKTGAQATLPQGLLLTVTYNSFILTNQHTPATRPAFNTPLLSTDTALRLNLPGVTRLPTANWQLNAEILIANNMPPVSGDSFVNKIRAKLGQVSPWEAYLDADVAGEKIELRTRQSGDTFCPLGLDGRHKKINEFMIDQKIPAQQRLRLPLLVANDRILWVCGHRLDERASLRPTSQRILHLKFERLD